MKAWLHHVEKCKHNTFISVDTGAIHFPKKYQLIYMSVQQLIF